MGSVREGSLAGRSAAGTDVTLESDPPVPSALLPCRPRLPFSGGNMCGCACLAGGFVKGGRPYN